MLSILIPIYNYDVKNLIQQLVQQCDAAAISYEIRCYDDGSALTIKEGNSKIAQLPHVRYEALPDNLGRSKIRNKLARDAKHPQLLFLDCDSGIVRDDFIAKYLKQQNEHTIVSGGRIYAEQPPEDAQLILHWRYGTHKESRPIAQRKAHPLRYFHSNNFLISQALFLSVLFDETIDSYGYEDLLFAQVADRKGIQVSHIDNPVEHLGLQTSEVFLEKTQTAIDNLVKLKSTGLQLKTNLENAALKLKPLGLTGMYRWYYNARKSSIQKNLHSRYPKLKNLDMFKLDYYLSKL